MLSDILLPEPSSIMIFLAAAIFISGIVCIFFWNFSLQQHLNKVTVLNTASINGFKSININLPIPAIGHQFALVIQTNSSQALLNAQLKDPFGSILNTNNFAKDFFYSFKSTKVGTHTLTISNLAGIVVTMNVLFGDINKVNQAIDVSIQSGLVIGTALLIVGGIFIIIGIIMRISYLRRRGL